MDLRQSWGTQYNKPPSASLTQPPMSGPAQNPGWIRLQEEGGIETCGDASHIRVVLSEDPGMLCCLSEE